MNSRAAVGLGLLWLLLSAAPSAAAESARAELLDAKGEKVGTALLTEGRQGVLLSLRLFGVTPGTHALHLHEVGKCDPPFETAGGHFNPAGRKHGLLNPSGMHAGDLPNVHVGKDGKVEVELFADRVTLSPGENSLLDADGSALVLHAAADDHVTDPAGSAGDRVACGVLQKP
jgi:superoxide dismutase, Cu-Zn family